MTDAPVGPSAEPAAPLLAAHPLTDATLTRLRAYAHGNGLEPDFVALIDSVEATLTLEGRVHLEPRMEADHHAYPGPLQGKPTKTFPTLSDLHTAVEAHKQAFHDEHDWLDSVVNELKNVPGHGWGAEGATITLPEREVTWAAHEPCSVCRGRQKLICEQCNGRGRVTCPHCQGSGKEDCPNCLGQGEDPANAGQDCPNCHGQKWVHCRFCNASGDLPCPSCQGQGGIPCTTCNSKGVLSEAFFLKPRVDVAFELAPNVGLPSGFLRALDRLGVPVLTQGHADFTLVPPQPQPAGKPTEVKEGAPAPKVGPIARILASLPYADLKLRLQGRVMVAGVFGKRHLVFGLPAFLDDSLKPWREKLTRAAHGQGALEGALEARAIREAFDLTLAGRGTLLQLRRLYPVGLSPQAAQSILDDVAQCVRRFTHVARLSAGALAVLAGVGIFAALTFTSVHAHLDARAPWGLGALMDGMVLLGVLGATWQSLNAISRWVLRRRYPSREVVLNQKLGITGRLTLLAIVLADGAVLALASVKPVWLMLLMHVVTRHL